MPVEVIHAEIEHCRDIEADRRESLQHIGRHFQHVDAVIRKQWQRQGRRPQIGTRDGGHAGAGQHMRQQRGRGRLPIRAGNPHEQRLRTGSADRLEQDFGVRQDRDTGLARPNGDGVRLRQDVRDAWRQHDGVEAAACLTRVLDCQTGRSTARRWRIIPGHDRGTHCDQRLRRGQAVLAQPHDREALSGEQSAGEGTHRIFNVARPMSAKIMEIIQNRITMVGSAQPFFSK